MKKRVLKRLIAAFMCSRCGEVYSIPYIQPVYAHYTNNVQDYYNYNNYK